LTFYFSANSTMSLNNHNKLFIFLFFLSVFPFIGFGQIHLNCCGVNQYIPHFKQDSAVSFNNHVLVKEGAIKPIYKSTYPIEIRSYSTNSVSDEDVTITKCNNDSVLVESYHAVYLYKNRFRKNALDYLFYPPFVRHNGLDGDTNIVVFVKKMGDTAFLQNPVTRKRFKELISSHIYDLPGTSGIVKAVLKKNPGIQIHGVGAGSAILEIKIESYYRNIKILPEEYTPFPKNVGEYDNLNKIYKILSQFKKEPK
jgi:hypothetical protein